MRQSEYHHLLYEKAVWEATIPTRKLRQMGSLILPMNIDIEEELHRQITTVPLLDRHTAAHTLREYVPTSYYLRNVTGLMTAIEAGARHRRTTMLQRNLAELTVHAIELQLPFIRNGLTRKEVGNGKRNVDI